MSDKHIHSGTADISYCTRAASLAKTLEIQSGGSAPLCAEMIGTWNRMASIQQAWLSYVKSIFRSTFKQSLRTKFKSSFGIQNMELWFHFHSASITYCGLESGVMQRVDCVTQNIKWSSPNQIPQIEFSKLVYSMHIKIGFVEIFQHRLPL